MVKSRAWPLRKARWSGPGLPPGINMPKDHYCEHLIALGDWAEASLEAPSFFDALRLA
jgi:hypothetical protein